MSQRSYQVELSASACQDRDRVGDSAPVILLSDALCELHGRHSRCLLIGSRVLLSRTKQLEARRRPASSRFAWVANRSVPGSKCTPLEDASGITNERQSR